MGLREAVTATLRSKRFWLWELTGAIIYSVPVAIRFATRSVSIPILNFPGFWIGHFIPGNFLEKLLVNAFFPGGAGGIAGETLISNYKGHAIKGKTKYLSRLAGAMLQTTAWSAFQYIGYYLLIIGPYGGNIFEHAVTFPINFTLAAFSIFTPSILGFLKSILANIYRKIATSR
jgi:hypothetical protein